MIIFGSFRLSASLRESKDAGLEEEDVEDDLGLLLFLDLCLFLDLSLLEIRSEREVCKVCYPISSCCQTIRLQHWDRTYYYSPALGVIKLFLSYN